MRSSRQIKRRNRRRRARYRNNMKKLGICAVLCLFAAIIFYTASAADETEKAVITLKAKSTEIVQNEKMPELEVEVSVKGDKTLVLDKKKGYTVENLADDLKKKENYQLKCKADGKIDGEFPVQLKLEKKLADTILKDWFGKVDVNLENGTFTVKNKYGAWEGTKFRKNDGEFAENEFIISKGNKYYFGEDGEKKTGWIEQDGERYYLDKEGIVQTGWTKKDGEKVYLTKDGSMAIGWTKIGKAKYFFDGNGKMLTGKQQVGIKKCKFDKDGKLISEEMSIDVNKPMIALTFDDGPGPETDKILKVLEENGARATFFMLGKNVPNYSDTVQKMQKIGCELGNHSTTHPLLTKLSAEKVRKEIGTTNSRISKAAGGFAPTVMRPPYGGVNKEVKANVGKPIIMWSVDTLDWKTRNTESTIKSVMNAKDGDIVLMHDIHKPTVEAAIQVIPRLIAKGYQLVTVSELAEARGISLKDGERYSQFYK